MADPGDPVAKPSAFFGSILLAARLHATTAETWAAIRDYSAAAGVALPPNMFSEVNRMRSIANSLRSSGEALAKAGPTDAITSRMIGRQLYARGASAMALAPAYHVRFEVDVVQNGATASTWYNLEYDGALPATLGDLQADVHAYADTLAEGYSVAVASIGTIEIGAF